MTKREKAVIDKIIDKIITCVELNQIDYQFLYISSVSTHNRLKKDQETDKEIENDVVIETDKEIENDVVIEIENLFGEGSEIRAVTIKMKSEYFTVEILERSKGNWRHFKSLEDGVHFPKRYAQRLYDYIEDNKYLILEHNKQEGNGFGFDADELV